MEDNRVIECIERAHYILSNLMAVKPGEEVLIAIDPQTDMRMANAMAAAAAMCGAEYGIYMMPIRGKDKATIFPKSLELGMDACDVFVGMTTASGAAIYNNHLKELINACREENIHVIFVQPEFDRRNAELIAQQTGTRVVDINPLAYDWEAEILKTVRELIMDN